MARPRKKLSKQKQAQRIQGQKKKGSTKEKDLDVESERVSHELEELKQKQKERRRRLMDEQGSNDEEYDDQAEEDDNHDGEDCSVSCTNPGCPNYTAAAFSEYDIQSNSVIIKQVINSRPALTVSIIENSLCDLKGVEYPAYEVERADARDFIVTFYDPKEVLKIIEEESVRINGQVYPAYVLPTGTNGDFFRDYSSQLAQIRQKPLITTNLNASFDTFCGIAAQYRRERSKYEDIERRIAKQRILMSRTQAW